MPMCRNDVEQKEKALRLRRFKWLNRLFVWAWRLTCITVKQRAELLIQKEKKP